MLWKDWFRPPRHLLAMFFGITLVSAGALAWLSWQLVRQDRALATQRAEEQRENAATLATVALQRRMSDVEDRLSSFASVSESAESAGRAAEEYARGLPEDSVLLLLKPDTLDAYPENHLLYYPIEPTSGVAPGQAFTQADKLELQQKDYPAAIAALKQPSQSADLQTRAEAMIRLGRIFRKSGQRQIAVPVYQELAKLQAIRVQNIPADLLARGALCSTFEEQGERDRSTLEASALWADLQNGRWRLLRPIYDHYADQVRHILELEDAVLDTSPMSAASEAAQEVWRQWQAEGTLNTRQTLWSANQSVLTVSRRSGNRAAVLLVGDAYFKSSWLTEVQRLEETHQARIALVDSQEHAIAGILTGPAGSYSVRLPSETGLPWRLYATSIFAPGTDNALSVRSRLVMAGLLAIAFLVLGGSYVIARAVARELAVAKLQSDFVTAVSHEFRTPLTALRQLSELLAKNRVASESVRQQYYEVLEHESARLHRLVEGLLKFGRMEAGAVRYQFEKIDATSAVQSVLKDFEREADRRGYQVEFTTNGSQPSVRADREALGCVLWNLLDNAVKYSPDSRMVSVGVDCEGSFVNIHVRDRGVGIPHDEQERIFHKFVRGGAATSMAVQGAGIGLAVARQIIDAHGGKIRVESAPAEGSTFTVMLPVVKS